MDDLLIHLLTIGRFVREQWPWVLTGLLGIYWLWYRDVISALPTGSRRATRRSCGG
jgi:hypothetical protein